MPTRDQDFEKRAYRAVGPHRDLSTELSDECHEVARRPRQDRRRRRVRSHEQGSAGVGSSLCG